MSASLLQTSVPLNRGRCSGLWGLVREKLAESEVAQRAQLPMRGCGPTPAGGHLLTHGGGERAEKRRSICRHLLEPRQELFKVVPTLEQRVCQRQLDATWVPDLLSVPETRLGGVRRQRLSLRPRDTGHNAWNHQAARLHAGRLRHHARHEI